MKIGSRLADRVLVVSVDEDVEIDVVNSDDFNESVRAKLVAGASVVLDVSRVEFFDSAGMASLLSLEKQVSGKGGRLALAGARKPILDVFRMVGFDVVFPCFPGVGEAVVALGH